MLATTSAMLERLASMVERLAASSAQVAGPEGSQLPNLSPAAGSRASFGGSPVFTGFDAQKLGAPLKLGADGQPSSAKYAFASLAQASGAMPRTKSEAETWFNAHIKPGLESQGFGVDWVKGDKALVRTRENPQGEVVDFLRGADSDDPSYTALAWQSEGPSGPAGPAAGGRAGRATGSIGRDYVLAILSRYPPTNDGIRQALEELRQQPGYEQARILEHPLRLDKIDFGNGSIVDVIVGSGGPTPSWGWMPE